MSGHIVGQIQRDVVAVLLLRLRPDGEWVELHDRRRRVVRDRVLHEISDSPDDERTDEISDDVADDLSDSSDLFADELSVDDPHDLRAVDVADDLDAVDLSDDVLADRVPDGVSVRVPDDLADRVSDDVADRVPQSLSDRRSLDDADRLADDVRDVRPFSSGSRLFRRYRDGRVRRLVDVGFPDEDVSSGRDELRVVADGRQVRSGDGKGRILAFLRDVENGVGIDDVVFGYFRKLDIDGIRDERSERRRGRR